MLPERFETRETSRLAVCINMISLYLLGSKEIMIQSCRSSTFLSVYCAIVSLRVYNIYSVLWHTFHKRILFIVRISLEKLSSQVFLWSNQFLHSAKSLDRLTVGRDSRGPHTIFADILIQIVSTIVCGRMSSSTRWKTECRFINRDIKGLMSSLKSK